MIVAEAFPLGEFIQDEMDARGWSVDDVVSRMGTARDYGMDILCVQLILSVHDPNLLLDDATAEGLSNAFEVSKQYFLNLERAWREWCAVKALEPREP